MPDKDEDFSFDVDAPAEGRDKGPVLDPEIVEERALVPVPTFDTQPALVKLLEFEKSVNELLSEGKKVTIVQDANQDQVAISLAARMKKIFNRLEEIRLHFVGPHWDYKKKVDNFFKKYTDPLQAGEKELGRKSGSFRLLLEQERRRQEAQQRAEADALQKRLDDEAKEAKKAGVPFEAVTALAPVMAPLPKVTRTEEGSASGVHKWTFEIEDADLVPREFLVPDEKLIRQAVKDGRREIPGCRIFEEMNTRIRV